MRHAACGLLVLVCLLAGLGCQRRVQLSEDGGDQAGRNQAEVQGDDQRYAQLAAGKQVGDDKAMEARQYLAPNQTKNGMWKTSKEQTLKWVNDFYHAGAAKVYALYIPADDTVRVNMCAALLIELPTDKEKRALVIRTYNRIDKQVNGPDAERAKDEGQKFLELGMDP